jgi:glucose-1-phosphate adenylyltransferase
MQGYWSDIGTPRRYWETNMDAARGLVGSALRLGPEMEAPTLTAGVDEPPAGGFLLGQTRHSSSGGQLAGGIGPEVIIGEGCELAEDARLVQSVLWPRVRVGRGVSIEGSIILNDVTIPDGSQLINKIVSNTGIVDL